MRARMEAWEKTAGSCRLRRRLHNDSSPRAAGMARRKGRGQADYPAYPLDRYQAPSLSPAAAPGQAAPRHGTARGRLVEPKTAPAP